MSAQAGMVARGGAHLIDARQPWRQERAQLTLIVQRGGCQPEASLIFRRRDGLGCGLGFGLAVASAAVRERVDGHRVFFLT